MSENNQNKEKNLSLNFADKQLPHSKIAEQSVLGSLFSSSLAVSAACEILKPDDFYFSQNREIFAVMLELFNENIKIDMVSVTERLNLHDKLDAVGNIQYLTSLVVNAPTTGNVEYYAKIIKDKATLRHLIYNTQSILNMAYDEDDVTDRILDRSEQMILDVASDKEQSDIVHISDIMMTAYDDMVQNSLNKGNVTGIPTGFNCINNATGGLHGGELIIIAGRPGMGKSSFAVNIAENAAIDNNIPVAIFNLEMSKSMIVNRIICSQALVDSQNIRNGEFTADDWMQICSKIDTISAAPIYIDDTSSISVSEIRAKCRRLKQTKNLGLVVIDYLQLMQGTGRTESRQQEISEISRSLKILAKELDIPVIALSQLSRTSESRSDKRPMLSDLRESGAIEQDADLVMFLYRDDYYNPESTKKNIAEVIIAKQRSGSTGKFELGWQGRYTKFVNIDYTSNEQ